MSGFRGLDALLAFFTKTRPVIFVSLLGALILVIPDQTLELYIVYGQSLASRIAGVPDPATSDAVALAQLAAAVATTLILVCVVWLGTMRLLTTGPHASQPARRAAHWMAASVAAMLPIAALLWGFSRAFFKLEREAGSASSFLSEGPTLKAIAMVGAATLLGAGLVLALILADRWKFIAERAFGWSAVLAVTVLSCLFVAAVVGWPVTLPAAVGTLALVMLFLAMLCYFLVACASFTALYRIPVVSLLVALAIGFSVFDLNDNHRARHAVLDKRNDQLESNFRHWLAQRKDRQFFQDKGVPYPVYIVAAEGGGLYAAYHVASFLAQLQDECPQFAQHTFAISSVSGGSLGASVFAALANEKATNGAWQPCKTDNGSKGPFGEFTRHYFSQDFLSPLAAAALFPDFAQRFLPFPVYSFDRAVALETAFESAWKHAAAAMPQLSFDASVNPFELPLDRYADAKRAGPILFLNTTTLETGARLTLSPLETQATPTALHVSHALLYPCSGEDMDKSVDMRLSTAVSLSARFPWLTPVGWLERHAPDPTRIAKCPEHKGMFGNRLYLADGAYFENSGLESAIELAARLRRQVEVDVPGGSASVQIGIITIASSDAFATRWWHADGDLSTRGWGEILSPIVMLMNTTKARTRAVDSRTKFDDAFYLEGAYFKGDDIVQVHGMGTGAIASHSAATTG
jgi:hypothetical protein